MGGQFLDHEVIGQAIIHLMQGERPRCAVAFWGGGATAQLFGPNGPGQAQILCDLSMNATNPAELEELGAPSNPLIRHLERLHAKVYISQLGAIVCSANASENGLGFGDAAGLVEAGVFLAPDTDAFQRAEQWFNDAWDDANAVDDHVLASAWEAWNRRPRGGRPTWAPPSAIGGPSLLGTVIADPARFRGVGFVFTTGRAAKADRQEAAEELTRLDRARDVALLSDDDYDALQKWPIGDLFTGWAERDLDACASQETRPLALRKCRESRSSHRRGRARPLSALMHSALAPCLPKDCPGAARQMASAAPARRNGLIARTARKEDC